MESRIRLACALLILLSLALAAIAGRDIERRVGKPFPGFMVFRNGSLGPPFLAPRRSARQAGLRFQDRITAVDGQPVGGGEELWGIVDRLGAGVPLRYTVARPRGGTLEVTVPTEVFSRSDFVGLVLPFLLGGVLLLAVSSVPVLIRPDMGTARVLFAFGWATATNYCFLPFDYFFAYRFQPWSYLPDFLSQAALLHLALTFPERRWPFSRSLGLGLALVYGVPAALTFALGRVFYRAPTWIGAPDGLALSTFLLGCCLLSVNVGYTALRSGDAYARQRARVVLTGPLLALVVITLLVVSAWGGGDLGVPIGAYVLLLWIFPVSIAYAMLKHNLFEFDAVARRGLTLGILVLGSALAYLAAFWGLQQWAGAGAAWLSAALAVAFLLVLTLAVDPLRRRVEARVESALFPDYRRATEVIHEASRELARLRDTHEVDRLVREAIRSSVRSASVRLVVGGPDKGLREIAPASAAPALEIAAADRLTELLRRGDTLNLEEEPGPGGPPPAVRRRLSGLGVCLVVPLPARGQTIGGFLLGPRLDGRLYTSDDQRFLETLAAQAAVAIANAQAFEEIRDLQRRLADENVYLRQEIQLRHGFEEIVGESAGIRAVLAAVERVAPTDATILVCGETGTGKELVVRALHARSKRSARALVQVACAAVPETLLESELFGHERGAFTGAIARQTGRFELADGGTIFLDDVDTLPLSIQAKLLRATQEGEIQRLGSPVTRRVDVRLIAATNRDLAAEVRAGRFREDLFYRLNVVPIHIPPLRERTEDIPLLVEHHLARECAKTGRKLRGIAADVLAEMKAYAWPGNVRELRNVIERAVLMSSGDVLRLPGPLRPPTPGGGAEGAPLDGRSMAELLRIYKIELITKALAAAGGNQRRAAELLGLHRPSLTRMIHELGLRVPSEPH